MEAKDEHRDGDIDMFGLHPTSGGQGGDTKDKKGNRSHHLDQKDQGAKEVPKSYDLLTGSTRTVSVGPNGIRDSGEPKSDGTLHSQLLEVERLRTGGSIDSLGRTLCSLRRPSKETVLQGHVARVGASSLPGASGEDVILSDKSQSVAHSQKD